MSEMVERVARALLRAHYECGEDDIRSSVYANALARAAIAAMREPTEGMLMAGNGAALATETLMNDGRFSCERATFASMIDAALAD